MLDQVMKALGYTFRDEALLRRALTHPSVGKNDNQRLEFLGDAVLQYLMSDALYRAHPGEREGALTHRRQLMVCEAALSPIAKKLGLHSPDLPHHAEDGLHEGTGRGGGSLVVPVRTDNKVRLVCIIVGFSFRVIVFEMSFTISLSSR